MGRGNEYRDRGNRRGFGDQPADPWGAERPPQNSFGQRPQRSQFGGGGAPAGGGREAEAKVKWFNGEKGFGFVELTDGSGEAFLHIRPVEAAGYSQLDPGTTLQVRVGQGQKGPQVTEVLSVDASTAEPAEARGPRGPGGGGGFRPGGGGAGGPRERRDFGPSEDREGQVKWFNPEKGFGFVAVDGSKDVFLHRSVLMRAGLSDLPDGTRVRMKVVQGQKGLEASAIELAE